MKIVVLDGYTENPGDLSWDELGKLGTLTVYDHTGKTDKKEIISRIGDAEAVILNKIPIDAEIMDACPGMKFIGILATGYNIIDIDAAKKRNIVVANAPAYSTTSVAQMVFALLLEICHHVGHHSEQVHAGRWNPDGEFCFWDYPLIELKDKTLGIIGYGSIGRNVASIAKAFGMNVIAYGPHLAPGLCPDGTLAVTRDEVFEKADVVTLHCPLFPSTQGMINKDTIAKMKDGVILINTSRGPLIVEQDLKDALESGKISAAGVDVVSVEPMPVDSILLGTKNLFITPHIAWAPKEARMRLMDIVVNNLKAYQNGNPENDVTKK